jgi:hypothetical protein
VLSQRATVDYNGQTLRLCYSLIENMDAYSIERLENDRVVSALVIDGSKDEITTALTRLCNTPTSLTALARGISARLERM